MVLAIQILGTMFGVLMLYLAFLQLKRGEVNRAEHFMWTAFWILIIIAALFPQIFNSLLLSLNLYRAMDLYVIGGFLFLVATVFYLYGIVRATHKKMGKIVIQMAFFEEKIKEIKKKIN